MGKNRKGIIQMTTYLLHDMTGDGFSNLFKGMKITHIDTNLCQETVDYYCEGDMFDEVERGERIPRYMFKRNIKKRKGKKDLEYFTVVRAGG